VLDIGRNILWLRVLVQTHVHLQAHAMDRYPALDQILDQPVDRVRLPSQPPVWMFTGKTVSVIRALGEAVEAGRNAPTPVLDTDSNLCDNYASHVIVRLS